MYVFLYLILYIYPLIYSIYISYTGVRCIHYIILYNINIIYVPQTALALGVLDDVIELLPTPQDFRRRVRVPAPAGFRRQVSHGIGSHPDTLVHREDL